MKLTTDAELAERMGISVEKLHQLRKRHRWPCVRLGRFEYRFTEAQIEQIVAMHTEEPRKTPSPSAGLVPGQTPRSIARRRAG
jgi:predicted site-specific integrase-resolvase